MTNLDPLVALVLEAETNSTRLGLLEAVEEDSLVATTHHRQLNQDPRYKRPYYQISFLNPFVTTTFLCGFRWGSLT